MYSCSVVYTNIANLTARVKRLYALTAFPSRWGTKRPHLYGFGHLAQATRPLCIVTFRQSQMVSEQLSPHHAH